MKNKTPYIGQKIYVPTSIYIDHGEDDFAGGEAIIKEVIEKKELPEDHPNRVFVVIEERPICSYNWRWLEGGQERWAKEYDGEKSHPDPDI